MRQNTKHQQKNNNHQLQVPKFGVKSSVWVLKVISVISTGPVPILSPALCVCCGAGSWSRLNSCRERERGSVLASPSLTLPPCLRSITSPALLQLCRWSLFQLDKCTLLQLQAHHPEKNTHTKKKTLPDLHTPTAQTPNTPPSRGQTLTYSSLPPMTLCTPTSTGSPPFSPPVTMVSLCPDNTNGLGFQLILLLFKRKKKGRHQHRIGSSGHSQQWRSP